MSATYGLIRHILKKDNCYQFVLTEADWESYDLLHMRFPTFCICENKGADQLHDNRAADQRPCFRYKDSTIPLLP